MTVTVLVILAVFFPLVLLLAKEQVTLIKTVSPLILCYAGGLLIGNAGILNDASLSVMDSVSTATVALSIPLMLFTVDIRAWRTYAGRTGVAFGLAALSVVIVAAVSRFLFSADIPQNWKLSGMLIGLYTGGTPNLAAIKTALHVDQNVYLATHASDLVMSAIYLLFVLTAARPLLARVLPVAAVYSSAAASAVEGEPPFTRVFTRGVRGPLSLALLVAVAIVGVGVGLSMLVGGEWATMVAILSISTLGIAASFSTSVRRIPMTFSLGEYFIYIFCFSVGTMGNLAAIAGSATVIFTFVTVTLTASFLLHLLLCRLFRVDRDAMMVASTAAVCSPPFVGMVAISLKNRDLIGPGITVGILGYAVGNYLGIAVAELLRYVGS